MIETWTCKHGVIQLTNDNGSCNCEAAIQQSTPTRSGWVKLIKMLRKPEDKGVGDTVQRIASRFGGERFKAFSERIGIPCGCVERQAEWNRLWPYT